MAWALDRTGTAGGTASGAEFSGPGPDQEDSPGGGEEGAGQGPGLARIPFDPGQDLALLSGPGGQPVEADPLVGVVAQQDHALGVEARRGGQPQEGDGGGQDGGGEEFHEYLPAEPRGKGC